MPPTNAEYAKINIACKELGLDKYEILADRYGLKSSKNLTKRQTFDLLEYFKSLGWKSKRGKGSKGDKGGRSSCTIPTDSQEGKIVALWTELHKAKVVRDKSDKALQGFVKTVTKHDNMKWCTTQQKSNIIEALKDMGKREGVELG